MSYENWIAQEVGDRTTLRMMLRAATGGAELTGGSKVEFDVWRDWLGHGADAVVTTAAASRDDRGRWTVGLAVTLIDVQPLRLDMRAVLARFGPGTAAGFQQSGMADGWEDVQFDEDDVVVDWHAGPEASRAAIQTDASTRSVSIRYAETGIRGRCSLSLIAAWRSCTTVRSGSLAWLAHCVPAQRAVVRMIEYGGDGHSAMPTAITCRDAIAEMFGVVPDVDLQVPSTMNDASDAPSADRLSDHPWHARATSLLDELIPRRGAGVAMYPDHRTHLVHAVQYAQPGIVYRIGTPDKPTPECGRMDEA